MRIRFATCVIAFLCLALGLVPRGIAQETNRDSMEKMTADAIRYLQASQQANGAFSAELGPAVTAIVATGLVRNGRTEDDPLVSKAVQYVLSNRRSDGGIYAEGSKYRNYETSIAVMLLSELNKDEKYQDHLQAADRFLKEIQWDEGEGLESSDYGFGGAGYGSHKRPDLSNTTFLIEALRATGNDADSEAIQRALAFVSRCQNLESEHNTTPFPAKNPDGGFYYTAAAGGSVRRVKPPTEVCEAMRP
ncbi:MAG: prenyltransferase/squalene oxidase repeat-containing protein [Pirellulaceae bacterium]